MNLNLNPDVWIFNIHSDYSDCLQGQGWSSSLTGHLQTFASIIWGPISVASLPLTVLGKACCWNSSVHNVSGNLVSNCRCSVTTEMDAGAAASIAGGEWLHQAHASSYFTSFKYRRRKRVDTWYSPIFKAQAIIMPEQQGSPPSLDVRSRASTPRT
jgi:hypothetical protein